MATYTTNLGLKKPAQSDKIRIADINNNMDDIDAAFGDVGNTSVADQMGDIRSGMAIVSTGNAHDAIAAGQFVYVMGHDTLDDGLYTANSALAANATLSSSNVTAVSGGGLNALNSNMANKLTVNYGYSSIGLTSAATTNQIFTAMPDNSKFIAYMNGTDKPAIDLGFSSGGIMEITKATAYRGYAIATAYDTYGFKIGSVLSQNQMFWKTLTVS